MRLSQASKLALAGRTAAGIITLALLSAAPSAADADCVTPDRDSAVIVSKTLNLISLNVAHGRGTSFNQLLVSANGHRNNLQAIASLLEESGAHVAALQEADAPSLWSGRFDHVEQLKATTGLCDSIHGHHATSWLFDYGAALLSRSTMTATRSHNFQPSWPTAGKGFVIGTIAWRQPDASSPIRSVTLVSVHLDFSRESVREEQIAEVIVQLAEVDTPLIVMGDFNADWAVDDSPVRELAGALGLHAFEPDSQDLGTYRRGHRLDWVLISPELRFANYTVMEDIVSDHLPVVARIGWEKDQGLFTDE